jgi:hypothetical protein
MEDSSSSQVPSARVAQEGPYRGEVAYIFSFDLAYDIRREAVPTLLGQPMQEYAIGQSKRSPKRLFFYQPQTVCLPPVQRQVGGQTVEIRRTVKLYTVGALSVQVRVPFQAQGLADLVNYHDLAFADGTLANEVKELAEAARKELADVFIRPVETLGEGEAYTVFCLHGLPAGPDGQIVNAQDWLHANQRAVAGVLTQEEDAAYLSEQEAAETTDQFLSYYEDDLVVVDWDAALVVEDPDDLEDILHIMELANVQLAELAAYDLTLDSVLDASYRQMAHWTRRTGSRTRRDLREIHVDLARLSDELGNTTKFFGDWHMARIYQCLAGRFHLDDWRRFIDEKLRTLGDLYEAAQQDRFNQWMFALEVSIVVLFVIDLVLIAMQH